MPLRTMPIGIYVIGEISEEEIETARVFKDYYRAYGLGDFRIIKVNPEKYTIDYTKFSRTYNENILLTSIASWYEEICAVIQRSR
ncbi:MAG: hypothetical protein E7161_02750 [Firmicutes bacterium]|nr:hypothetical protein [Bacillota bacterium]